MKTFLLIIGFAIGGFLTSSAEAQIISLTIDSAQSSVDVSLDGNSSSSQISGVATFDIQSATPPSGSAQITDLDLVLDDALNFSFFFGIVSISSSPGDLTISMATPGAPGMLTGGTFTQLENLLAFEGELNVSDPLGFAGGNQTFDLSEIAFPPVDFNSVNVTQVGDIVTISNAITITDMVDLGAGDVAIEVDVTYVATGIVPATVLLGDVNLDTAVDFLDIAPFIAILSNGGFQDEADIDGSGEVDFLDVAPFIGLLSS